MTRVVIIGGSGHVGTYLVPRLVEAGFHVVNVSRGQRQPYTPHKAWGSVEQVAIDREAAEGDGAFGGAIFDLKPDILIDMTCFTLASAKEIVEAVKGEVEHFLHTGTIWVHGPSVTVPTTEMQPRKPFGDYGVQKAAIEAYLLHEARRNGFPATIVHPGHIVGRGWEPLNPEGHFEPAVFTRLARGEEVLIPNLGMETVHHVHADDVAQMFMRAIARRSVALGEAFHTVSPAAITLRGYAEAMAAWFGQEPNLAFLPWPEWKSRQSDRTAQATWDHIAHSPNCSIDKARAMLGYQPRYTSLEAVQESVAWLIEKGIVRAD
ncbi:NAD-dependent epimerase/dehydratase family protein [Mesorhizobium sp. BR1-1-16]|uniref:NAD-dependent epimerase/dehydratase family protein n=1 Tax=Mesorhizobium sp. BR1-1-16 TaxID=2876653 RepID=UPI001CCE6329|nr:NAD-dependent epimerase/dehydratase family protein [Mesorhizobium sp. BR1-1-16]MBZ9939035.1 NAD-dependent epimerase/dehydratase family protein [Mesorhizobium sp. BR1-1-16]